jgi:hypothetical protein
MKKDGYPGPGTEIPGIDPEVIPLVDALNSIPGIYTLDTCSGHGSGQMSIFFRGERQRAIARVLYWFDSCHSGERWTVKARTDCGGRNITFCAESFPRVGEEAWASARHIAACLKAGSYIPAEQ